MNKTIFKTVIGGALLGTFIFFTGPLILIVLLLKFIFTPFGMGRMMMTRRFWPMGQVQPPFAFAEKIRNMSEEDYTVFQSKIKDGYHYGCGTANTEN